MTRRAHPAETALHSYSDLAARTLELERRTADLEAAYAALAAEVAALVERIEALEIQIAPDPRVAE